MANNKAQKKKHQKKVARRKRLDKTKNKRGSFRRFRLDVKLEGVWRPHKYFKTINQVRKHVDDTEKIRKEGKTEIVAGRVIDLDNNTTIVQIKPFIPLALSPFDIARDKDLSSVKEKIDKIS